MNGNNMKEQQTRFMRLKTLMGGGQTLTEPVGWLFQEDTRIHIPTGASFLNDTN